MDFIPFVKKFVTHVHQSPSEWSELKNCQAAVLAANAPQGSGTRVSGQESTVTEVAWIEVVDEAVLLQEVEKHPKWVLPLINDGETRWRSTYAIWYAIVS